jgi:hypothetical protein
MSLLSQFTRLPYVLGLWERFPCGSVQTRVYYGIFPYPHYAYGVYWAAIEAVRLGIDRITVMEFGVAGGRGLLALEYASTLIEGEVGVRIDVVGFDSGAGMPPPLDYRDLPHIWGPGFYLMQADKLRARLTRAQLLLGDVGETLREWLAEGTRAPVGFVAFDLDYYSSTKDALTLFEAPPTDHLPRVYCYFDDVCSNALGCMSEYLGELLAIREFNESHPERKIGKIQQVRVHRPRWEMWHDRMYAFHDFAHPEYNTMLIPETVRDRQLPL